VNTTETTVAATCTAAGSVTVTCDDCGEIISTEEIAATGHSYDAVVTAPTCTVAGYTTYTCSACGDAYVADEVAASGHNYESVVTAPQVGVQGYTTHTCSVCGDSYVDSYTDPLPEEVVLPTGTYKLMIRGAGLSLANDLKVFFNVHNNVFENYSNVYFVFTVNGVETTVSEYEIDGNYHKYKLGGIGPRMIGDTIDIKLYGTYQGQEYVYENTYTAATYCYNQVSKGTNPATLKTLIVDLLNYGYAHQQYMNYKLDAPVNGDLTEEQKAYASTDVKTFTSVFGQTGTNNGASFRGANLTVGDAVVVRYTVQCDDLTGVTLEVTIDGKTTSIPASAFELIAGYTNRYYVSFAGMTARQMRQTITATVCRNGEAISKTATYSAESYVTSVTTGTPLYTLVEAMIRYGDSAAAYFASNG